MKKIIFTVVLIFCCLSLFAFQETYNEESYEIKAYNSLRRIVGNNDPVPTLPITGSQLLNLLEKIDVSELSEETASIYSNLVNNLNRDQKTVVFKPLLGTGAELNLRTAEKFTYDSDLLFKRLQDYVPVYNFGVEVWASDYFAGYFDAGTVSDSYVEKYSQNVNFSSLLEGTNGGSPFLAWLSIGNSHLNFSIGRDKLSAGKGFTGNLTLGNNFFYEDYAKLSVVSDKYSYDMTMLDFEDSDKNSTKPGITFDHPSLNGKTNYTILHRFSFELFDCFTVSGIEGMLVYCDNVFNLKYLSPFMVFHDIRNYGYGNCNNFLGIELSSSFKGFEISAAALLDQIQTDGEKEDDTVIPNANAFQLSISHSSAFRSGLLDLYLEGVYSSPVVYLKDDYPFDSEYRYYDVDLVLGNVVEGYQDAQYLGYLWGNNTIAIGTGASYISEKLNLSASCLYLSRGSYRKGDYFDLHGSKYLNVKTPFCLDGDVVEHVFMTGVKASYAFDRGISLKGSLGFVSVKNYQNRENNQFNDFQVSLSASIDVITLSKSFLPFVKVY